MDLGHSYEDLVGREQSLNSINERSVSDEAAAIVQRRSAFEKNSDLPSWGGKSTPPNIMLRQVVKSQPHLGE